jgi:hypothetical protein
VVSGKDPDATYTPHSSGLPSAAAEFERYCAEKSSAFLAGYKSPSGKG